MRIHIVRPKETFVTIANKYQVTLDDLRQFNPDFIQPDCLVAGMKVYIPNLKKVTEAFQDNEGNQEGNTSSEVASKVTEQLDFEMQSTMLSSSNEQASLKISPSPVEETHETPTHQPPQPPTVEAKVKHSLPEATEVSAKKVIPKRKFYEPWPPIKRTAQSCQYYCGYCDHCR